MKPDLDRDLRSLNISRPATSLFRFGLIAWVVWAGISLTFFGIVVAVVWHFVAKYW